MNIAVLSDIHGNHIAFETCMKYLSDKKIDAWFLLGDYIGEFPGIEQTMKLLYDLQKEENCYILRGNKEEYQLMGWGMGHSEWDAYPSTVGMLRYANDHLTPEDLSFFKSLSITQTVKIQGMPNIVICHGSPRKVKEKFMDREETFREVLAELPADYLICGHTHRRADVIRGSKHIWNPGSVGAPLDETDRIPFLILHSDCGEWVPEFVSLEADTGRMIEEMRDVGLYEIAPFWTRITEHIITSKNGDVSHGNVLNRAMAICRERFGECVWPKVPEECFQQAYEEMCSQ